MTDTNLWDDLDVSIEYFMQRVQKRIELRAELERHADEFQLAIAIADLARMGIVEIAGNSSRKQGKEGN